MLTSIRSLSLACLLLSSSSFARAEVWVVDAGLGPGAHFEEIQEAVDAASDGDIVLVRPALYGAVEIVNKSLTLQADSYTTLGFEDGLAPPSGPTLLIRDLAPHQSVVVGGFQLSSSIFATGPILEVRDCMGPVLLDSCNTASYHSGSSAWLEDCASVVFTDCILHSSTVISAPLEAGLTAIRSNVQLYETILSGQDGFSAYFDENGQAVAPVAGTIGARLVGSTLFASGRDIAGGQGGWGNFHQGLCLPNGDGGPALQLESDGGIESYARTRGVYIEGGSGGNSFPCSDPAGSWGPELVNLGGSYSELSGSARHVRLPRPVRAGENLKITYFGSFGDTTYLIYGSQLLPPVELLVGGWLHEFPLGIQLGPDSPSAFHGQAVVSTAPNLPPGVLSYPVVAQGLFVSSSGELFLSGPSSTLLLAATL